MVFKERKLHPVPKQGVAREDKRLGDGTLDTPKFRGEKGQRIKS